MVVKIYGISRSAATKRVLMTCHELGVEYQVNEVNAPKGEHKSPEYIANMHPFGVTPVLIDVDGTQIYESRAIARYLVVKYGKDSTLMPSPSDPRAYGLFEQAASIEYSSFDPATTTIYREIRHSHRHGREPDNELIEKSRQTLLAKFQAYERILSKQKYLAGDTFTLADLFHIQYGRGIELYAPEVIDSQPNVKRWWSDITARESWKKVAELN